MKNGGKNKSVAFIILFSVDDVTVKTGGMPAENSSLPSNTGINKYNFKIYYNWKPFLYRYFTKCLSSNLGHGKHKVIVLKYQ